MREGRIGTYICSDGGTIGKSEESTFGGSYCVGVRNSKSNGGNIARGKNMTNVWEETSSKKEGETA